MLRITLLFSLLILFSACQPSAHLAPVFSAWEQPNSIQSAYVVAKGDTLYAIAWRYGKDFRQLAVINHLTDPYSLITGQRIRLNAQINNKQSHQSKITETTGNLLPAKVSQIIRVHKGQAHGRGQQTKLTGPIKDWCWPAQGSITNGFSKVTGGNKGVDISGQRASPIVAAASGQVVYAGSGVRGYGNLLIIKHNDEYISAYAYLDKFLVKNQEFVKAGAKIAEMGSRDQKSVMLHFEIRRAGKPVNPLIIIRRT